MQPKKQSESIRPNGDDDFHMADTDVLETLSEADTDVMQTLEERDRKDNPGFDPYNKPK